MSPYLKSGKKLKMKDFGSDLEVSPSKSMLLKSPVPLLPTCEMDGCNLLAIGGTCEYKVCFTSGCGKQLCKEHTAQVGPEEPALKDKMCTGCKDHVKRIQIYALAALIVIPIIFSVPAIVLYSMATEQV